MKFSLKMSNTDEKLLIIQHYRSVNNEYSLLSDISGIYIY